MIEEQLYHRFLAILGVSLQPPTYSFLSQLIRIHLSAIPFENISKLYYRSRFGLQQIPPFDMYLEGIEKHHFGGTCYSNNYYFFKLLQFLGYRVQLCAADMKNPGSHMVTRVSLDQQDYLVDVGYAAPFAKPVQLDSDLEQRIIFGRDCYIFKPAGNVGTELLMYRDGSHKHGYTVRPDPRSLEDFSEVIAGSFHPGSTFFQSILLTKFDHERFLMIHNMELVESTPAQSAVHPISDLDELARIIEMRFRIKRSISREVIAGMDLTSDAWS